MREEAVQENCHALEEVVDLRSGLKDATASREARIGEEGEDGVHVLQCSVRQSMRHGAQDGELFSCGAQDCNQCLEPRVSREMNVTVLCEQAVQ